MNREEMQLRDKFLHLAEFPPNQHKQFMNVKRKPFLTKQASKGGGPKLSVQDFVRMDPGYTPDIEHLVFPATRKRNPQQVAPSMAAAATKPSPAAKTRSRLAEMFALSRHLQQRSADREIRGRHLTANRSVDSVLDSSMSPLRTSSRSVTADAARRWATASSSTEVPSPPIRQSSMVGARPSADADVDRSTETAATASARGSNVSVLHLRSTSEPWESPSSSFQQTTTATSRSYLINRSTSSSVPPLTKHQSLGSSNTREYQWQNSSSFHSGGEVNSPDMFVNMGNCSRELSPVRWCDREVDGVYLGKSGWVQVQQRSLDESKRFSYPGSKPPFNAKRSQVKLSDYHFNSEPSAYVNDRPAYLSLQSRDYERKVASPSPPQESFSSPSVTPIISPPPAFQDKNRSSGKSRSFFGKTPFLPRSNAIEDSDASPPPSPQWKSSVQSSQTRKPKVATQSSISEKPLRTVTRMPQTKSLEDTTANRRSLFSQHSKGSSSSSSSSMGFRSLDSNFNRPGMIMPRLSENTDSSVDQYQDADEEDNNSSSVNISMTPVGLLGVKNTVQSREKDKISPSGRSSSRSIHHRSQLRRSPAGSDSNKNHDSSSSSSSDEFLSKSPPRPSAVQQQMRRSAPTRGYQQSRSQEMEEAAVQRVRRSRSLQLPEKKLPLYGKEPSVQQPRASPQHPDAHRTAMKLANAGRTAAAKRQVQAKVPSSETDPLDDDMLREAEVVTGFLYGNRSRAAAQALLMHRYNNNNVSKEEKNKESNKPINNGLTVYYVGNQKRDPQKILARGATSPSLPSSKQSFERQENIKNPCTSDTCDFWPHCAHRDSLGREANFVMRSSHSYPTHQRSLDSTSPRSISQERKIQDQFKRRTMLDFERRKPQGFVASKETRERSSTPMERRPSPNRQPDSRRTSPVVATALARTRVGTPPSGSSSGSDAWLTASGRTGVATPPDGDKARPGSAPAAETGAGVSAEAQRRSMSLPKSFLSAGSYQQPAGGTIPWQRHGTESLGSSPGLTRKIPTPDISHTAPVTPLHEGNRRRSPVGIVTNRRAKATSTPQLLEASSADGRKWSKKPERSCFSPDPAEVTDAEPRRNLSGQTTESVLQKFRKSFSLRFQPKLKSSSSKENRPPTTLELAEDLPPSASLDRSDDDDEEEQELEEEENSPLRRLQTCQADDVLAAAVPDELPPQAIAINEHKYKFGSLVWRTSKEKKRLNKAARSTKCNSGDSGIQIEMVPGCGPGTGDSSESHDAGPNSGDEPDTPPVPRRPPLASALSAARPHSELFNQILIDKFKAELKQRAHPRPPRVRRTRSDLGGQRPLPPAARAAPRRAMSAARPQSPRKRPPDAPGGVVLRRAAGAGARGALRRSLSQPVDIDKLSPLMRTKTAGLRLGESRILSEDDPDNRLGASDDDMMSDSESSLASLTDRKKSLDLAMDEDVVILAEAVFDHVAIEAEELGFRAGDVIEVLETANRDWWWGTTEGQSGWFPAQFVRLRVSQEDTVEDCLAAMASGDRVPSQIRRRTSISLLSNDQVRTSVVRELVHTERDFVKVLRDVSEGYISECRKRVDMFTDEQIDSIFINIEGILKFQTSFLKDLEACIEWDAPYKSCVGTCFLQHRDGFKMYSDYCNSHPVATATLQELYRFSNYSKFFETCRLMRGLIEIPLDGYLLTPVQRICKYPLQLAELLKYTKTDHEDYENIKEALEVMRGVATLINERKRRMESLEKLASWQQRVEGWEGEDLIEISSQLIHQGDVVRVTTGMWTNNITLFLFDHQIVYCKKDILKRSTYVYKGRICLDTCEIIDVPDGKDAHLGVSVRHAIKLYSVVRDKWLLFCCRSSNDKQRWLRMFSEERKLIAQDKDDGLEFPPSARHMARIAGRSKRRPPRKPRNGKNFKHDSGYMGSTLQLNTSSQNSLGRKVGTWFTFSSNKKTRHQHPDVS